MESEQVQFAKSLVFVFILRVQYPSIHHINPSQPRLLNTSRTLHIEPIEVHNLVPGSHKVLLELVLRIALPIHLSNCPQLGLRAKDEVVAGSMPLLLAALAVDAVEELAVVARGLPLGAHVEKVHEEVVGKLAGLLGEDTGAGAVPVGVEHAETANQSGHLGRGQGEEVCLVDEELLGADAIVAYSVVAEAVNNGLEVLEGLGVGLLLRSVGSARREGHGETRRLLERGDTSQDNEIGEGDLLAAGCGVVELLLDALESAQDGLELRGVVHLPAVLGLEADAGTVCTTTLVASAEAGCRRPSRTDELGGVDVGSEDLLLQLANVRFVDEGVVGGRYRVLPNENLLGDLRAEPAGSRAHVTVQELEPCAGEDVAELVWVVQPPAGDLLVCGVEAQGQVAGQHARLVLLVAVVGVGDDLVVGLGHPLVGARGALGELPLVLVEVLEVLVGPLGRLRSPDDLETRSDGIWALAAAVLVGPAEALVLERGGLRLGTDVVRVGGAVRLAERVAADDQRSRLLVVHGHAAEGGADVAGRSHGVGDAVRALGVHVDETHVRSGQGLFEVAGVDVGVVLLGALVAVHDAAAAAGRALATRAVADVVAQPRRLAAPVDRLVGLVCVGAAAREAEGGAAHGLDGDVAGEQEQVGPRDLVAVLLLDGPQQAAGLVERDVVGPAVERGKALLAFAASTAAVGDAVGAGAVPGHAHEQAAVVAKVGGPPVLRVGHEGGDVLLEAVVVEALEGGGIVEVLDLRVGDARVLAQDVDLEVIGPPVAVAGAATANVALLHGALGSRHDGRSMQVSCRGCRGEGGEYGESFA